MPSLAELFQVDIVSFGPNGDKIRDVQVTKISDAGKFEVLPFRKPEISPVAEWISESELPEGTWLSINEMAEVADKRYVGKNLAGYAAELSLFTRAINSNSSDSLRGETYLAERLKGLKVLDVGCGSATTRYDEPFPPNFCRILHIAGADVIGVDRVYPLENFNTEDWPFVLADVTEASAFDGLEPNSFDVINMGFIISFRCAAEISPSLCGFQVELDNPDYKKIRDKLMLDALRLLKVGGLLIIMGDVFQKVGEGIEYKLKFVRNLLGSGALKDPNLVHFDLSFIEQD